MARSMIQRRQDAERERIEAYDARLRQIFAAARPVPDFERALDDARSGLAGMAIRDGALWRPKLKTRDRARLRLAAARYLYARYPVSAALESVWLDSTGLDANEIALRKAWYVTVARGDSLYKAGANAWLSRKEVHCFLNVSGDFGFAEAFWLAIARSYTDDQGLAVRLARTKIARTPRHELAFWREVARFFCGHPASKEEIDDLCDYIGAMHQRDAAYSLKGRTLASLRRQMVDWHRDIAAIERIEAMRRRAAGRTQRGAGTQAERGAWDGSRLEDWEWQPSAKEAKVRGERFFVRQLKTAEDLVAESRAMHHCVSTCAAKCIAGNASIWVLRRTALGKIERLLTIELDPQNRAVQVRGFGNRLALPEERKVVERWAKARGVVLRA
ncbi:PcfJ domain-containing protein [Mesorhizobium dulcispinae]|uniref:PcfJ domain-containing protein n=1 Tax=Mesorhizobium dulcispinae TaxID=3072316 RepID=UPI002A244CB4|nr:PcfJ domain-containing protein [Mesorhizobium sp. VK23D]MDX8519457.1 PcfJ domain-containing protein [Mesorhizobium sp. VK23D]